MELRELRYFLAVAREKNITKAADALYISQPSLSKQMQNLEKEIGSPLFVRGSRSVALTETGMLLKKRAEELLELYEKTESETATQEDARAVRALWEDKRSKLHVFIPHNDISYVDYRLNEAFACLYTKSYPDALANLEIVMQMAKSVPGNYMIKLENIF